MAQVIEISRERYDHKEEERLKFKAKQGLSKEVVEQISTHHNEPEWMLKKRLQALEIFNKMPMPNWGPSLVKLNLDKIHYFMVPDAKANSKRWEDLPEDIKRTFERLGIPEAEKKALAGAGSQYESMAVYHNLKKEWEDQGVIFEDCSTALKEHEDLFKKYFMTSCVPVTLHKFAALHGAVWSSGSFIYVPPKVKVKIPIQAYFRMNAASGGQFEHTLIIVDKGAEVNYIEGCSSPIYVQSNLHAGCVEIHVKEGARARYNSIENWSRNTFN